MSQDKELEIRRQFLDEAEDYLQTLEDVVLGLSHQRIDAQKINGALRAAHSIKGGAGMMGYQALTDLSHCLEDSFKVLKLQKQSLEVDSDLVQLLLKGIDCMRHVISCDRQGTLLQPDWLTGTAQSVFEQLHQRLGDPPDEDASSVLSADKGQDLLPLLFESEVEICLQRLEAALNDPEQSNLRDEVLLLAQELGGLGEMLQLEAFSQLCASVADYVAAVGSELVNQVSREALQAWRRSQALVLTYQLEALPRAIAIPGFVLPEALPETFPEALPDIDLSDSFDLDSADQAQAPLNLILDSMAAASWDDNSQMAFNEAIYDAQFEPIELPSESVAMPAPQAAQAPPPAYQPVVREARKATWQQPDADSMEPDLDATVRVSVKQLNQLNDLFGELTIDRNALDLYLKRLRNLAQLLGHRVHVLEQSNSELQTAYDRLARGGKRHRNGRLTQKLLPAGEWHDLGDRSDRNGMPQDNFESPNGWPLSSDLAVSQTEGFDALEMDRYDDLHLLSQQVVETIVQVQEVTVDIDLSLEDVEQTARTLNKTANQLQTRLTQVRMRPLADIVDRFPRALRELCLQHGKKVRLEVSGANTLIDRNILETLNDPLMHLFRNAFDHGIEAAQRRVEQGKPEEGVIKIQAFHRGSRTIITLQDDGNGIPIEKIRDKAKMMGLDPVLLKAASDEELVSLIFEPGFSTTDQVTSLSGRGVGMDVVRASLKQARGEIKVDTQAGKGTTFTLSVPFTLSVVRVLLVESNGMLLAFPIDAISEILALDPEAILQTAGSEMLNIQGTVIQLIALSRWLKFHSLRYPYRLETPPSVNTPTVLLVQQNSQVVGIQVDCCWGEQETAVRRVDGTIPLPPGFSNCTILGDGRVVPLVNVTELLHWIASSEVSEAASSTPAEPYQNLLPSLPSSDLSQPSQKANILVVDDSINVRRFLALTLEKAGYQVEQAKDGQEAVEKLQAGLQVNAVVCDIEMPRLDGYGFLAKIKSHPQFEHLPVTMLTSRTSTKHRQLALSLGAIAYFSKPYNEQALLANLAHHIHGTSPLPANVSL